MTDDPATTDSGDIEVCCWGMSEAVYTTGMVVCLETEGTAAFEEGGREGGNET